MTRGVCCRVNMNIVRNACLIKCLIIIFEIFLLSVGPNHAYIVKIYNHFRHRTLDTPL